MDSANSLLIYAPNVHEGGGLSILSAVIKSQPSNLTVRAILDIRCKHLIQKEIKDPSYVIFWVNPTIHSRLSCEVFLKVNHKKYGHILCLHNIPPILCRPKKLSIFFQNQLLIDRISFKNDFTENIMLVIQKIAIILFSNNNTQYIVQSQSVKNGLVRLLKIFPRLLFPLPKIDITPFADLRKYSDTTWKDQEKKWDFIYPASLYPHKNHKALIAAWILLKKEGVAPSLALTLSKESMEKSNLRLLIEDANLNIHLLGILPPPKMLEAYLQSSALIYPSKVESLGLPLLEASALNLPIISSDLDYVFEVCAPAQTFNPDSALSICMAIKRHLNISNFAPNVKNPEALWSQLDL